MVIDIRRVRHPDQGMFAIGDVGPGGRPDVGLSALARSIGHASRASVDQKTWFNPIIMSSRILVWSKILIMDEFIPGTSKIAASSRLKGNT